MSQNFNQRPHVLDDLPVYRTGVALTPGPSPEGRGELEGAPAIVSIHAKQPIAPATATALQAMAIAASNAMPRDGSRPNGASERDLHLRPPSEGAEAGDAASGPAGGVPPAGAPLPVIRCASGTSVAALRQTVAAAQAHFLTGAAAVVIEDPAGRRLTVTTAVIARLDEHLRRLPHQGARERARRLRRAR